MIQYSDERLSSSLGATLFNASVFYDDAYAYFDAMLEYSPQEHIAALPHERDSEGSTALH
jgi:hypothetical protein